MPYLRLKYRIAKLKDGKEIKNLSDLRSRKVAVSSGLALQTMKRKMPQVDLVSTKSIRQSLDFLMEEKVEFVVDEDVAICLLMDETKVELIDHSVGISEIAIAVPKGQKEKYDNVLTKLSGLIANLIEAFLPGEPLIENNVGNTIVVRSDTFISELDIDTLILDIKKCKLASDTSSEHSLKHGVYLFVPGTIPIEYIEAPRYFLNTRARVKSRDPSKFERIMRVKKYASQQDGYLPDSNGMDYAYMWIDFGYGISITISLYYEDNSSYGQIVEAKCGKDSSDSYLFVENPFAEWED